jgi:hypothetical protein
LDLILGAAMVADQIPGAVDHRFETRVNSAAARAMI